MSFQDDEVSNQMEMHFESPLEIEKKSLTLKVRDWYSMPGQCFEKKCGGKTARWRSFAYKDDRAT